MNPPEFAPTAQARANLARELAEYARTTAAAGKPDPYTGLGIELAGLGILRDVAGKLDAIARAAERTAEALAHIEARADVTAAALAGELGEVSGERNALRAAMLALQDRLAAARRRPRDPATITADLELIRRALADAPRRARKQARRDHAKGAKQQAQKKTGAGPTAERAQPARARAAANQV